MGPAATLRPDSLIGARPSTGSVRVHQSAFDEIAEIAGSCGRPGWDGFDADPVTKNHLEAAIHVVNRLPVDVTTPTVGAEPDGQITLEWYVNPKQLLSVSVDPIGELHYAGMIGDDQIHGRLANEALTIRTELVRLIRAVLS